MVFLKNSVFIVHLSFFRNERTIVLMKYDFEVYMKVYFHVSPLSKTLKRRSWPGRLERFFFFSRKNLTSEIMFLGKLLRDLIPVVSLYLLKR